MGKAQPLMLQPERQEPAMPARINVSRPAMPMTADIEPYLKRIDETGWYSNFGPLVTALEDRLSERFIGPAHVVTATSATTALTLALQAMGCKPGTYVALPSWTFVATAHAVMAAGLLPWFLAVDGETSPLSPSRVRASLKRAPGKVSALLPVCPHGLMVDIPAWTALRSETGLPVLIDAAAAFDALADATLPAVVSLHATKALGIGEGGFFVTQDEALARRFKELTSFGFRDSRTAHLAATNAKVSEYSAAVGHAALDLWPSTRLRYLMMGQRLRMSLIHTPLVRFQPGWAAEWMSSVCVVTLPHGTAAHVEAHLAGEDIQTRRWWSDGCHTHPAFAACKQGDLSATERLARSTLGLPFSLDLDTGQINRIASALTRAVEAL